MSSSLINTHIASSVPSERVVRPGYAGHRFGVPVVREVPLRAVPAGGAW